MLYGSDSRSFKPLGPLREIVCEMLRAVDALQRVDSSMAERHNRQRKSSLNSEELLSTPTFDLSLSLVRNKVDIVAGKFACNVTTNSSVNRPILAVGPN